MIDTRDSKTIVIREKDIKRAKKTLEMDALYKAHDGAPPANQVDALARRLAIMRALAS